MNNFNLLAPIYDKLAQVVFGQTLISAQAYYLDRITPHSKVLVCGGGTGSILEQLDRLQKNLQIDYLEKSSVMIHRSRQRGPFNYIKVTFKNEDLQNASLCKYDVIITPFFLDVFSSKNLSIVINRLTTALQSGGQWIVTDFYNTQFWYHQLLIKLMFFFFRITSQLEGNKLLDFDTNLSRQGLVLKDSIAFRNGLIRTSIWTKSNTFNT